MNLLVSASTIKVTKPKNPALASRQLITIKPMESETEGVVMWPTPWMS